MRNSRRFIAIIMAITILFTSFSNPVYAEENFNQGLENEQETVLLDEKNEDLLTNQDLNNDSLEEISDETKETTPDIICEVEELRGENYKQFLLKDSSYLVAMYEEPIHYMENGEWVDIDNSLSSSAPSDNEDFQGFENNNKQFKVKFAKKAGSSNLLKIKSGDASISWSSIRGINKNQEGFQENQKKGNQDKNNKKDTNSKNKDENNKNDKTQNSKDEQDEANFSGETIDVTENLTTEPFSEQSSEQGEEEIEEITNEDITIDAEVTQESEKKANGPNQEFLQLDKLKSEVIYHDILPNIDLQYILSGSSMKENIIIKEKADTYEVAFELNLKKLELQQQEDGSIHLVKHNKGKEEIAFIIPAPYMYDSNQAISNDVKYIVEPGKKKDNYILHINASEEWINQEERQFPVIIDPIVNLNTSGTIEDACVGEAGNLTTNQVIGTKNNSKYRIYVKPTALPVLSKGDVVVRAEFSTPVQSENDALKIGVFRVGVGWSKSTITWANAPGNFGGMIDYFDIPKAGYYTMKFDITQLVRAWCSGTYINYGILLQSIDESKNASIKMRAGTTSTSAYTFTPNFTIIYRNNKGIENYWDYKTMSAGEAGTACINRYTGNMILLHNDLTMNGNRMPIDLYHVYSTDMAGKKFDSSNAKTRAYNNLNVGYGFKLNLQRTVTESNTLSNYYIYVDEDGTEHHFTKGNNGLIEDEDGLGYGLTINSSTKEYTITDKYGNQMLFNSMGYLKTIKDSNQNALTVTYDSTGTQITGVTDGSGRVTSFYYNSSNYLNKITDPSGRSTSFSYSATYNGSVSATYSGYLRTITYPDGKSSNYTYLADGTLDSVKNSQGTGYKFLYTTDSAKRVSKVTEIAGTQIGEEIKISYDTVKTIFRTVGVDGKIDTTDDLLTSYWFDSWGHTTSVYSETADKKKFIGASIFEYNRKAMIDPASFPGEVNKIIKTSQGLPAIVNLISNSNVESNDNWGIAKSSSNFICGAGLSADESYLGINSIKLDIEQATTEKLSTVQTLKSLEGGKTYTLSAYVKTRNVVKGTSVGGAGLSVEMTATTGKTIVNSEYLTGTTEPLINHGWQRMQVTFQTPKDCLEVKLSGELSNAKGIAWFDAFQLEEGDCASSYNMVENSGFELGTVLESWNAANVTSGNITSGPLKEGKKAYIMNGVGVKNRISQNVLINKSGEQTYIISGWAQANSAVYNEERKLALGATIYYTDGTTQTQEFDFNPYCTGWQYISGSICPSVEKTVSSITVEAICDYSGVVWLDNITMVFDQSTNKYTYDTKGNLLSSSQTSKTTYSYTNDNNVSKIISPSGYNYQYSYDDKNNLTSVTSEAGVKSDLTYDAYGNPLTVKTGNVINTATYLNGNYLSTMTDTRGKTTYYNYDQTKGLLLNKTDANRITTIYTYDPATDYVRSTYVDINRNGQEDSQDSKYSLVYANKRLKSINHNNFNYNLDFNEFGDITSINVNSIKLIGYNYTGNNRRLLGINYYGASVEYAYDSLFRIISKRYNGILKYEWKYDTQGNIYKLIDNANGITYNYEYDNGGRLIRQLSKEGLNYEVGYDIENRVNKLTYKVGNEPSKTQKITYVQDSRIQSLTLLNNLGASYNYDSIGRVTSQSLNLNSQGANKVSQNYTYLAGEGTNSTYMVGSIEYNKTIGGTTSLTGSKLTYTYDALGNIETISEAGVLKLKYYYDNLNQLIKEEDYRTNAMTTYVYDLGGNIQSKSITYAKGTPKTYTYGYDGTWKDLLTSFDGKTITYNSTGSPINYLGSTLQWEYGRSLSKYTYGSTTIDFKYDVNGNRTSKEVIASGVSTVSKFYYEGDKLVRQQTGNNAMWFLHDENGKAVGIEYNGVSYYYQRNLQGDIIRIVDTNGNVVASYAYDSWGKIISSSDSNGIGKINPLRYRGYYYDEETGWYYLQSRYYNPEVGRFLNADDARVLGEEQGNVLQHNLFTYCYNNPIMYSDPSGYFVMAIPYVAYLIIDLAVTVIVAKDSYDFYKQVTNAKKKEKKEEDKKNEEDKNNDNSNSQNKSKNVPQNPVFVSDKWLKKNGVDAHSLKKDLKGNGNNAIYDIYVDKSTGRLWVYGKGGKGIPDPTYIYIK